MPSRVLTPSEVCALFPAFRFFWEDDERLAKLWEQLNFHDSQMRFVGGCVRDALLGRSTTDIDVGTVLRPAVMQPILERYGYVVQTQGARFGSLRVSLKPYHVDITTLRQDVRTDGRWAEVAYTEEWSCDVHRRDFTMNALSMNRAGFIFDEVGGIEDLQKGRVLFVGNSAQRIQEDVLRILRFVRFHQYYGQGAPDVHAVEACRAFRDDVRRLSKERIAQEWMRILKGPCFYETCTWMHEMGLDQALWGASFDLKSMAVWRSLISKDREIFQDPFRLFLMGLEISEAITKVVFERCAWTRFLKKRIEHRASRPLEPWAVKVGEDQDILAKDAWARHAVDQVRSQIWTLPKARRVLEDNEQGRLFLRQHPLPLTGHVLLAWGVPPALIGSSLSRAQRLWLQSKGTLHVEDLRLQIMREEPESWCQDS